MARLHSAVRRNSRPRRILAAESLENRSLLATLPIGFEQPIVAEGLLNPTTMTFATDGRLFVAERDGTLKIVTADGVSPTPLGTLDASLDFGVNGMATDPNFATNGYLYIYYTRETEPTPTNRLSRFQISASDPNQIDPLSETVLIDGISGGEANFHNGGFLEFGTDGLLYLGVGDGLEEQQVQDPAFLHGKILRLDPANYPSLIPATNPYVGVENARSEVWAVGFRNPYTGAINPITGDLFVNDVGSVNFEEINRINEGGNFGWPLREGIVTEEPYVDPVFAYPHDPEIGGSITGGAFYYGLEFPGEYLGDYFFGDYTLGFIKRLDTVTNQVTNFASELDTPVDLEVGPDGQLYWLSILGGTVRRIDYSLGNHAPEPAYDADPTSGLGPLTVHFNAAASEDHDGEPLTYTWDFGDDTSGSGLDVTHTYAVDGSYSVVLTVSDGALSASTPPRTIVVGDTVPNVSILNPITSATYRAGDTISFAGDAVDRDGEPLPDAAFEWSVVFHHRFHIHPFVPALTGVRSGTFTIPTTGETDAEQFYRVHLTVTNEAGLSSSRFVDIRPETSPLTLETNIPGLKLLLDSSPTATPHAFVGVENMERELEAPLIQQLGDDTYEFERWSDDESRIRTLVTPIEDGLTYTAIYRQLPREATIVAAPVPQWYVGEVRTYDVSLTNETLETWSATGSNAVKLAVYFGNSNLESGAQSATLFDLPHDIPAGTTAIVPVTITAPVNPGEYVLRHRLVAADGRFLRGSDADALLVEGLAATYEATPPTDWLAGTMHTYSITLTNTGAEAWRATGQTPTRLGVYFGDADDAPYVWSQEPQRFDLPHDVDGGESVTIEIEVLAPTTPGNYVLRHRMVKEQVGWFLPMLKTNVVVGVLNAAYSAIVPEVRTPSETLSYVIHLTNNGSSTWNALGPQEVHLGLYFSGNSDAIYDWSVEPIRFSLPNDVPPAGSVDIPITLAVPTTPGTYTLRQRMVKEGVRWFDSLLKSTVDVGTISATYSGPILSEWAEGSTRTIPVTITNSGTVAWSSTAVEPLHLGYYFNAAGIGGAPSFASAVFLPLGTTVPAGGALTINVPVIAPATAGQYRLELRLARGNFAWLPTALGQEIQVGTRHASYSTTVAADWWTAEQRTVSVSVTNTGTLPWNSTGTQATRLGFYFVPSAQTGLPAVSAGTFISLPNNVVPGQTAAFAIPLSAPASAGDYRLEFRLEKDGEWFADGSVHSATIASLTAVYAGTVPTEWPATATKSYTLTLTNNSTRTWLSTGTDRVQLQATFTGQPPVLFALPNNVAPGASATITMSMQAPATAGTGTIVHRLILANGTTFISSLTTNVTIGSLAATYVSNPPTTWLSGQTRTFNVTLTNTGTSPWRMAGSNPTKLGVYFQGRSDTIGDWVVAPQLVGLTSDVLPGQSITLAVTTTAPTTAGSYVLRLRMYTTNASWFTPLHRTNIDVGTLSATYASTPPTTWITGQTQTFTVTVTNTGTGVWRATGTYRVRLGVYFNGTSDAIGAWPTEPARVSLPNDVLPGQSVTLTVAAKAPAAAGTYILRLRMVAEWTAWFAPLHKTTVAVQTLAANYTATVPTVWLRNQLRTFNITLTNTGTATWNATGPYPVRLAYYFDGRSDVAGDWTANPTRINLPRNVAPGQSVTFAISVRAPATAGTYTLRLRLVKEYVAWFSTLKKTTVTVK